MVIQTLLTTKYLSSKCLSQVHIRPGDSHFLKGLLKVREDFLGCGTFKIKDGSQIRLWKDTWVDTKPMKDQFPNLYNIVHYPHVIGECDTSNAIECLFSKSSSWG